MPGVKAEPIDATRSVPTVDEEGEPMDATKKSGANVEDEEFVMPSQIEAPQNLATSVPCSIVLRDVSNELKGKKSIKIPYTKEEMCRVRVCVKRVDQDDLALPGLRRRKRQRTQGNNRPSHKAKDSVNYVFMDATSGEDAKSEPQTEAIDKSSPSGYRLAAHHYMVARKQGLIQEPRTRTCALKIEKTK